MPRFHADRPRPSGTPSVTGGGSSLFVTGTDTGIGKTLASALLVRAFDADYWKPIQSGTQFEEPDAEIVARLAQLAPARIHPTVYALREPLSPHEAARRDGVRIELDRFSLPQTSRTLIVEGAGGVLVPLNDEALMVDLMARLALPVVLVARTALGTINHTLLSLEALRARGLVIHGIVLSGEPNAANREAIERFGKAPILCELPRLDPPSAENVAALAAALRRNS